MLHLIGSALAAGLFFGVGYFVGAHNAKTAAAQLAKAEAALSIAEALHPTFATGSGGHA